MPLTDEQFKENLIRLIREHYEKNASRPLLLSHLGAQLDRGGFWPEKPEGRSLKRLIEELLSTDFELVRDPQAPAFIAVVPRDQRAAVEAEIEKRQNREEATQIPLEDISRAVLLAFCIEVGEEKPVYIRRFRPFRYELDPLAGTEAEYIIVEPEYRTPGLRIDRLGELPRPQREEFQQRIHRWADAHHVKLEQFSHMARDEPFTTSAPTALDRFLAAQSPEVVRKILIPGDIAQMLSRRK